MSYWLVAVQLHPLTHASTCQQGMMSFFRRLCWSPDGSFLVAPAGSFKSDAGTPAANAAYVFARGDWGAPLAALPSGLKPSTSARFCPVLFQLSGEAGGGAGPSKPEQQVGPSISAGIDASRAVHASSFSGDGNDSACGVVHALCLRRLCMQLI